MIDGVGTPAQADEVGLGQSEPGIADVPDHDAQTVCERVLPDFGQLERGAQALQPMRFVLGPDQAVHDQLVALQEVAEQETADETGRPGQENLPKSGGRYWIVQRAAVDALANETPQRSEVPLTLRRQCADQRRHRPGVDTGSGHVIHHRESGTHGPAHTATGSTGGSDRSFTADLKDARASSMPSPR